MTCTTSPPAARRHIVLRAAAFAMGLALSGCAEFAQHPAASVPTATTATATAKTPVAAPAPAPAAPPQAAAPASPPPILPYADAVMNAANTLLTSASEASRSPVKIPLIVDPLIDGMTGEQTIATQSMGEQLVRLVREKYPQFEVERFTAASVAKQPFVLIGTLTPVNKQRQTTGQREAYRICLAMADLKTGKLVSKGLAFAQMQGVDATPTPFFREVPAWTEDPTTLGYIRTCQGTKAGDPVNALYVDRIVAAALISDAIDAYNAGRYRESL